jgi:Ni,Fe-hydrogenase III component G
MVPLGQPSIDSVTVMYKVPQGQPSTDSVMYKVPLGSPIIERESKVLLGPRATQY